MSVLEELRLLTKVASLYYEHNLRQTEIAQRLNLSQASISRLLKRATDQGIVRVSVEKQRDTHTDLESAVEQAYGLKEVIVVDTDPNNEQLLRNLGAATAYYLETTVRNGDYLGISSWSETLLATANAMRPLDNSTHAHVVQILGGLGNPNTEMHAGQLTYKLARLVNGQATILNVPGVVSSQEMRDMLLSEPNIKEVTQLFERVTIALVGIGAVEPSRLLAASGNVFSKPELVALSKSGAVGDVCLRFFDRQGAQVVQFDDRVIGMSLEQLRHVPRAVGVAAGSRKYEAIRGAVKGGFIHVLITDNLTAQWLLDNPL